MIIEKVEGGYIVNFDGRKIIATAEHVANLITRYMKDVTGHIDRILELQPKPHDVPPSDNTDRT